MGGCAEKILVTLLRIGATGEAKITIFDPLIFVRILVAIFVAIFVAFS